MLRAALFGFVTAVMVALLTVSLPSCTGLPEAKSYDSEIKACVADASTKHDSQSCRCAVDTKYHRPCDPPTALNADGGS